MVANKREDNFPVVPVLYCKLIFSDYIMQRRMIVRNTDNIDLKGWKAEAEGRQRRISVLPDTLEQ